MKREYDHIGFIGNDTLSTLVIDSDYSEGSLYLFNYGNRRRTREFFDNPDFEDYEITDWLEDSFRIDYDIEVTIEVIDTIKILKTDKINSDILSEYSEGSIGETALQIKLKFYYETES